MAKIKEIKNLIAQMAVHENIDGQFALNRENTVIEDNNLIVDSSRPYIVKSKNEKTVNNISAQDEYNADKQLLTVRETLKKVSGSMQEGKDYGQLPKVKGNTLYKRGALRILNALKYKHNDNLVSKIVDVPNNFIGYTVRVTIVDSEGNIITESLASANSHEKKFCDKAMSSDSMLVGMAAKRALILGVKEIISIIL